MRVITGKKYIMKIKSIIWSTVAVMLLSACASEEIIDTPVQKSGSVTIRFASANTVTKATAEEPNTWATAEETTIENYTIAVFEGTSLEDNSPCIKVVSGNTTSSTTTESETGSTTGQTVKAYSVSVTDLPINTPLSFLVIANSITAGLPSYFTPGLTYKSFDDSELTDSFEASKLIKVGKKENVTFQPSSTPVEVKVPLIQLTARIDFAGIKYTTEGNNESKTETTTGEWEVLSSNELKNLYGSLSPEQKAELDKKVAAAGVTKKDNYVRKDDYLYFNYEWQYISSDYSYRLFFQKREIESKETSSGIFSVEETSIEYQNEKSDILFFDTSKIENDANGLYTDPKIFENTFYTYELKDPYVDQTLILNIKGGLTSSTKVRTVTEYRVQVQKRTGKGKYSNTGVPQQLPSLTKTTENIKNGQTISNSYAINIPYANIIKGHIYKVTGNFKPSVTGRIEWVVEDWTEKSIEIGFGK